MSLSCACGEYDGEGWLYYVPDDYTRLDTKRSRKCCSCNARIAVGDLCAKFLRQCTPEEGSVDHRIYGDEKALATWWMCEACADQYFNLKELGFCINLGTDPDMRRLLAEYVQMVRRGKLEDQ